MTASALTIPEPLPDDPDAVTTALETAAIFGTQGDAREAVRWLRRAAEAAGDEGNDMRALALARLAADMTSQIGGDASVAPPATGTAGNGSTRSNGDGATLDAALGVAPAAVAEAAPSATANAAELGLAPTVSAQPPAAAPDSPAAVNGAEAPEPSSPGSDDASAAPAAAPAGWVPPPAPPPVTAADAAPPAEPAATPVDGAPREGSLRAALQRFSQHASQPAGPAATSQPPQPDPQQSPALAALVQSIARSQPAPAANTVPARPAGIPRSPSQAQPLTPRSPMEPKLEEPAALAPVPVPELERTPPGGLIAPASEPSDAITDPRYVPAVAAKAEAEASSAASPVKKSTTGARRAVRASIAATTEEGVFLLELLKDGQPATSGHEALVVLVDPSADLFE